MSKTMTGRRQTPGRLSIIGATGEWCRPGEDGSYHWYDYGCRQTICGIGKLHWPIRRGTGPLQHHWGRGEALCRTCLRYVLDTRADEHTLVRLVAPAIVYAIIHPWPAKADGERVTTKWNCPTCSKVTTIWNFPGSLTERDFCSPECWAIMCLRPEAEIMDPVPRILVATGLDNPKHESEDSDD